MLAQVGFQAKSVYLRSVPNLQDELDTLRTIFACFVVFSAVAMLFMAVVGLRRLRRAFDEA
jgi:hypothetical protein